MIYRFGEVEVDVERRQVRGSGELRQVPARAFEILVHLIENRDRVVSRRELFDVVWPEVVVEDGSLTQNVSVLRRAIGDDSADSPIILTIPGNGYRFTGELREESGEPPAAVPHPGGVQRVWIAMSLLLALSLALIALAGRGTSHDEGPISIAVLPVREDSFRHASGKEGLQASARLIAGISRDARLSVRPMSDVVEFADPRRDTALDAGRQLGVDLVLEGSFVEGRGELELQLIDVERREVIWTGTWRPSAAEGDGVPLAAIVFDAARSRR